eukprot:15455639-Alexandrium_andersonii.AAC.1
MLKRLHAFEPGTARAHERPRNRSLKIWRGAFCLVVRADAESAAEAGRRARQRRFSGGSGGAETPPSL